MQSSYNKVGSDTTSVKTHFGASRASVVTPQQNRMPSEFGYPVNKECVLKLQKVHSSSVSSKVFVTPNRHEMRLEHGMADHRAQAEQIEKTHKIKLRTLIRRTESIMRTTETRESLQEFTYSSTKVELGSRSSAI